MAPDRFTRFAAIDWSGARGASHKGIALAVCETGDAAPVLVAPPGRAWSRAAIRDWLHGEADSDLLVGLDLSPGFAFLDEGAYFPGWTDGPADARALWAMVDALARDDADFGADGVLGDPEIRRHFRQQRDCGDLFPGGAGRMRVCEVGQRAMGLSPTSCFNLVGAAQVGKSSLTGMRVLHALQDRVPTWPFDPVPNRGALIVEIYTTIAARAAGMRKGLSKMRDADALDTALVALGSRPHVPIPRYDDHATDAILTAAWLRANAARKDYWTPTGLTPHIARTEGWTFGVAAVPTD
ncbi:hypothetical protein FSB78_05610 [Sphingomonas ginsenosidivorax]|uniref:DUF429 domain-containing protein n=1 Tax=Sphingomonas ginsenosidivorax TaxID=862135 RepID=A0A5C6UNY5_9SPHN|nr:hypothetical protein [Sphingomonas ginsenosidivorax]TXC72778.1 hypothetical protein FSB78_05610 [Sphingomonas ginsenosidivorax]